MLKKIMILIICGFSTGLFSEELKKTFAEKKRSHDYIFSTNPLDILDGLLSASLGVDLSQNQTIGIIAGYTRFSHKSIKISGYNLQIFTQYYFSQLFTDGYYARFGIGHNSEILRLGFDVEETAVDDVNKSQWSSYYTELVGGYRWVWSSGFHINLGAGVHYAKTKGSSPEYINSEDNKINVNNRIKKVLPATELAIGYTF